jgi:uncharacterized BrkB/YihY/UPF0761 family membrane protein
MIRKRIRNALKVEKVNNKDRQTYVGTMLFFMLFLLTLLVVVITSSGVAFPEIITMDFLNPILTELLMIFIIAQLMIIILILHKMSSN